MRKENERQGGTLTDIEHASAANVAMSCATFDKKPGAGVVIREPCILEKPRTIRRFSQNRPSFRRRRQEPE